MNNEEMEVRALPYVLVLHAFCVVDPPLCAPASDPSQFVVTLQPYLKTQVIYLLQIFIFNLVCFWVVLMKFMSVLDVVYG
jgi:hypothetical protein